MLGGDENDIVGSASDSHTFEPERLRVNRAVCGAGKEFSERLRRYRRTRQRIFILVHSISRRVIVVRQNGSQIGDPHRRGTGGVPAGCFDSMLPGLGRWSVETGGADRADRGVSPHNAIDAPCHIVG